jgi:hypothetical protein
MKKTATNTSLNIFPNNSLSPETELHYDNPFQLLGGGYPFGAVYR